MKKRYEVYLDLWGHEVIITVETDTREDAIKKATQQFFKRHILPNLRIYRANAKGKELPSGKVKCYPVPLPEIKVTIL